ncbi:MAG: permease [Caldilineaceae bacterium]|nr:permease [Caldilineaceae bacterium]
MFDKIHSTQSTSQELSASPAVSPKASTSRTLRILLTSLVAIGALYAIFSAAITSPQDLFFVTERAQTFVTIFLGIFIEAAPFLLAGSIVSGFIAVFVDQQMLERFLPRQPILAALVGASLGIVFPVCECGVVPVTRRLYEKGLPLSMGIAFLLAAPVINPVVIVSTYAAFGWGTVLIGRIVLSLVIAFLVGLLFYRAAPGETLLPDIEHAHHAAHAHACTVPSPMDPLGTRFWRSLRTAGDDFMDMARYLIIGSMLAAAMQTLAPQAILMAVGQGPVASVLAMQTLAFVLSVCSTVDAFLALAFTHTFTSGSILAFLVFGPMVDIKSALMFMGVFQKRTVIYLILLPFLFTLLFGVFWNLNIG